MAKITSLCKTCGKVAIEKSVDIDPYAELKVINLECGHSYTLELLAKKNWEDMTTVFGAVPKKVRKFQGEGYEFARNANFRAIIADEPGVGKTVQPLICIKYHAEELLPALFVVKAALTIQQMKVIIEWLGPEFQPQIIKSTKEHPNKHFGLVIVTYDLLNRFTKKYQEEYELAEEEVRKRLGLDPFQPLPEEEELNLPSSKNPFTEFGFKTVILDECQQIKNQGSKRSQAVRDICRNIPHVIATSGSPIENNAGEYFTILNIVNPERFPSYKRFLENDCDYYFNGRSYKIGGLRDVEEFRRKTGDFIIRRKQSDVLQDIPKLDRKFVSCEFTSKRMEQDYLEAQKEFEEAFNKDPNNAPNLLAKMAILRHLAGINKIVFASEYIQDFLMDTNRKLAVFLHHKDVHSILDMRLKKICQEMRDMGSTIKDPVNYTSDLSSEAREEVKRQFIEDPDVRIFIGGTRTSGEGLDGLQSVCSDCIILERDWNPKKEEQAEKRIQRFGSYGSAESWINAFYILSAGTIDELFTELVEIKRMNTDQTLDGSVEYQWNESSLIKELSEVLMRKGGKKWRMS